MRLCAPAGCEKLVWRGSYYDGIQDSGVIFTRYTVDQWSKSGIKLSSRSVEPVGRSSVPIPGAGPFATIPGKKIYIEGIFTGPIAADKHSIENGVCAWKLANKHGEITFTLTWEADKSTLAAAPACPEGISNLPKPAELEVCDGACIVNSNGDLGAWTFNGNKGSGNWVYGDRAALTIQEWVNGRVGVSRDDPPAARGLDSRRYTQALFAGTG